MVRLRTDLGQQAWPIRIVGRRSAAVVGRRRWRSAVGGEKRSKLFTLVNSKAMAIVCMMTNLVTRHGGAGAGPTISKIRPAINHFTSKTIQQCDGTIHGRIARMWGVPSRGNTRMRYMIGMGQ